MRPGPRGKIQKQIQLGGEKQIISVLLVSSNRSYPSFWGDHATTPESYNNSIRSWTHPPPTLRRAGASQDDEKDALGLALSIGLFLYVFADRILVE